MSEVTIIEKCTCYNASLYSCSKTAAIAVIHMETML